MCDSAVATDCYIWRAGKRGLGRIAAGKQTAPASLSRNRRHFCVRIASGAVRRLHTCRSSTTVGIAHEDPSLLVYVNTNEVEQIAMRGRTTTKMNAIALDRIIRRCVRHQPVRTTIEGRGNVQMP